MGVAFLAVGIVIGPVFIAPLFNKYKPLENRALKQSILSLARANGIPATDVYEMDASKQSKRVSANVSGFLRHGADYAERQFAGALFPASDSGGDGP